MAKKKAPQPGAVASEDTKKSNAGRTPRKDFTDEDLLAEVRRLASMGMLEKNIAYCLGYHPDWFSHKKKALPQLAQALKEGAAIGEQRAIEMLTKEVEARSMTAIIFYLKAKHGWRENVIPDADGADGDSGSASRRVLERVQKSKR